MLTEGSPGQAIGLQTDFSLAFPRRRRRTSRAREVARSDAGAHSAAQPPRREQTSRPRQPPQKLKPGSLAPRAPRS